MTVLFPVHNIITVTIRYASTGSQPATFYMTDSLGHCLSWSWMADVVAAITCCFCLVKLLSSISLIYSFYMVLDLWRCSCLVMVTNKCTTLIQARCGSLSDGLVKV